MKREIPLFITAVIGLFMILSFFVPHQGVSVPADFLQQCAVILVAFGYVLGGANALRVNFDGIYKRQPGWIYKIVLVVSLLVTVVVLSAIVPTAIAQRWFSPSVEAEHASEEQSTATARRTPRPLPAGETA